MEKVLLVIGDASEVLDTFYPLHRIREEDFEVVVAAPEKRTYHLVQHDTHPEWDITVESPGYKLDSHIAFRDVQAQECLGLFLSGGRAPEYLRYDEDLIKIVKHFFSTNKPVASICHGAEILAAADVIRNKQVATVPKCQYDVEFSSGVNYQGIYPSLLPG